MRRGLGGVLACLAVTGVVTQTVTVTNGTIQGVKCSSTNVNSFLGIPFAQPPTGNLRYSAPQSYDSKYNGILQATTAAPNCIQFGLLLIESGVASEDCLFLDVYVPANASSSAKLPVKVWIYGGSNEAGGISDPTYNGCFSASNSVVVSVNYRLGSLGWLALPGAGITGNFGLQDQLLALQWVQENIAAFNGDPTRVLVFGQSAGAIDTYALSTLPYAAGKLFSAAASESGGGRTFPTVAEAQAWNTKFAAGLNCSATDAACLRAAPLAAMNASEAAISNLRTPTVSSLFDNLGKGAVWGTVVDGTIVPDQPADVGARVPAIFGSNSDDGTLFVLGQYLAGSFSLNETDYDLFLQLNFGSLAARVNATYPVGAFAAASAASGAPPPAFYAMSAVITDFQYQCPAFRALQTAAAKGVDVYGYRFNHTPSCSWLAAIPSSPGILALLGSTHTAEIPFVFNLTTGLPPPSGNCSFTEAERAISAAMLGAWDSMAATGSPGWPKWVNGSASQGLVVNGDTVSTGSVDFSVCAFWDEINAELVAADANGTATATGSGSSPTHKNFASKSAAVGNLLALTAMAMLAFLSR